MATTWTGGTVAAVVLTLVAGLGADGIAAAQTVSQPAPAVTRRAVVSIPDRTLTLFENDAPVRVFPVAVGAPKTPSPVGRFTIVNRVANPSYYRRDKVIGPGPSNPLGTRWLGLDAKSYGIHGTDDPTSIGYARSHGCIRMHKHDVEELFALLRVGDVVELRNAQPVVTN